MTKDNEDVVGHWGEFADTYGRPLLERLLLSLIDAHPTKQVRNLPEHILHDREARLSVAMEALFNEKPSQKLPDHAALRWMAEHYVRDQQTLHFRQRQARDVQPRSERQLAQEASVKFYPGITDKSERLRKKW